MDRGSSARPAAPHAPARREVGHLLAAAERVVQRREARLQVLAEVLAGDGRLRQDPLARHLLAPQDLQRGDDRGAPLERRVRRRLRRQALGLPLLQELLLVLTADRRQRLPGVLERLQRGDACGAVVHPDPVDLALALQVVRHDALGGRRVVLGELDADDVHATRGEDPLGRGPAVLQHVDAGQHAQREHLPALADLVGEELRRGGAERVTADGVDERHGAVGVDAAVEHDHRHLAARRLDSGGQRGGGVRGDDERVAVAADELLDVGDLLVVARARVECGEVRDLVGVQVDLGLHGGPADLPPRVVDRCVGEADVVRALGGVLRGVHHLGLEHLHPRLVGGALRGLVAQGELPVVLGLVEELARGRRRGRPGRAGRRRATGRHVAGTGRGEQ